MGLYRGYDRFPTISHQRVCRLLLVMAALFFTYTLFASDNGFCQIRYRQRQLVALRQEVDRLRAGNARLEKELVLLKEDLGTIERIARERYGMVKPNESVYMVYPCPPGETTADEK